MTRAPAPGPTDVAAFYRFAALPDPAGLRPALLALGEREGLRGTVLLAREGVNGTVAGPRAGLDRLIAHLRGLPGCADLIPRFSRAEDGAPFARFKVRLKREIVTMGRADVSPAAGTGVRVSPGDWNALIGAPDVALIDTRNAYEVALGSFEGAIDPGTAAFSDFPAWWEANRARFGNRRVAMFCTGGIRCEKSTALLRADGVEEVYHLDGGILSYLEQVPAPDSLWRGECFVFDQRVSLSHGLEPGTARLCHACRRPVTPEQTRAPEWEDGVSCPHCWAEFTEADRARFRERHRQVRLAAARGQTHLA